MGTSSIKRFIHIRVGLVVNEMARLPYKHTPPLLTRQGRYAFSEYLLVMCIFVSNLGKLHVDFIFGNVSLDEITVGQPLTLTGKLCSLCRSFGNFCTHYPQLRKMFLSPRRESNQQPSDLR